MSAPSPAMRDLARRLLDATRAASSSGSPPTSPASHEVVAVCETLRVALTRFAGADGFAALLRRSLTLARVEAPVLEAVHLGPNCQLRGLEEIAAGEEGVEAAVALAAHLLTLLVTFIGEALTRRLVREGWPDANLDV